VIELLLLVSRERQHKLVYNGNGRRPLNNRAQLVQRAMEEKRGQELKEAWLPTELFVAGHTQKSQERHNVFQGIDEWRTRDDPAISSGDSTGSSSHLSLSIANLMGFVKNNAIPDVITKQSRLSIEFFIVGNEDRRALLTEPVGGDVPSRRNALPTTGFGRDVIDDTASTLEDGSPCIQHGQGSEEESMWLNIVNDNGSDLNSLTESHVIALESTANNFAFRDNSTVAFLLEHPLNAIQLVGEVGEATPKGL
jgi:hypothetical protein